MFEMLQKVEAKYRYDLDWVKLSEPEFSERATSWLDDLKPFWFFQSTPKERLDLAQEFLQVLVLYRQILMSRSRHGVNSHRARRIARKIQLFTKVYKSTFSAEIQPKEQPLSGTQKQLAENLGIVGAKMDVIRDKRAVVDYWLTGVRDFNPHQNDVSLLLQYMGNAESSKVRLFLDVLMRDADKIIKMPDPRPALDCSGESSAGLAKCDGDNFTKVTWTNDDFKRAVKAEFEASYGVRASGKAELNITGIKAELKGSVFAGGRVAAEAGLSHSVGAGFSAKASVEAMIGIQIKADANLDVGDIFLIEASAEAFAGAMAKAEVEVTATIDGVAFKLSAEAFAGAKIKGKAGMTLRMCGYDIIKGEAEAYLSAGVGAEFKFEFSASTFDGVSVEMGAGLTVGLGGGTSGKFKVYPDNLGRVANSLFYTAYLTILGRTQHRHAWTEYLRNLEDNEMLFKKAVEILEEQRQRLDLEYQTVVASKTNFKKLVDFSRDTRVPTITAARR